MDTLCRLCLKEKLKLISVFDIKSLAASIELICGVSIKKDDCLPQKICAECYDTVKKAHELRNISMRNDKILKLNLKAKEERGNVIKIEPSFRDDDGSSIDEQIHSFADSKSPHKIFAFVCDYCSETAPSKMMIKDHIRKRHCTIPTNRDALQRNNKSKESFVCLLCSLKFESRTAFRKHEEIHEFFEEKIGKDQAKCFQCRHCSRTFDSLSKSVSNHIARHKRKKTVNRKYDESLVCPHCGQIYRSKQILSQHIKRHFETGDKFSCSNCAQKFKTWGELYYHKAVHTTDRNFICDICNKAFKAKRDLRNHKIRHETKDVKKFQCSHCQLKLKNKYTLNRHILIHTGEKKFNCMYCQKSFIQKNELNKHLRLHIGENTYRCEASGCTEAFRLLADLRIHQQVHYERSKFLKTDSN